MVERRFDPSPVRLTPGCYRIPDGDVVPQPPSTKPAPEPEPVAVYVPFVPTRYHWLVLWSALAVVAVGVLIGSLR